jgi:transcriptional regulator with XRE-family HTH domain
VSRKQLKPIRDAASPAGRVAAYLRGIYSQNTCLTLAKLASDTGYSQGSLSEALSGRTMPSLELLSAFVEGCGRDDVALEAEHVWRREKARSQGSTRPPRPDRADTWEGLHEELVLLAHESGFFTPKALCDGADQAGHPITHTSAHRWLTTSLPLRLDSLHTILSACKVSMRHREPWVRAHDRASKAAGSSQASLRGIIEPSAGTFGREALFDELRQLSRGPGVQAPDLSRNVGPALRQLCDLTEFDGPETVRRKVGDWVQAAASDLPTDLHLAVTTPLGLNPQAQFRLLRQRVEWLAEHQDRSTGTSRRRIDEAMARLAEAAFTVSARRPTTLASREHSWHVREFEAILSLDGSTPRCIESRTIVADRDGLDRITWSLTLPRENADDGPADLDVAVVHGAQLLSLERPSARRFVLRLGLPRRLKAGERHDYALQVSVPTGQQMLPRYVFWPERRCERFRLVARFGHRALPSAVWRVDHVFHRDEDEIDTGRELVPVDDFGEVYATFADLQTGHGYGIRWN